MIEGLDINVVTTIINNINNLYSNLVAYTVGLIVFVGAFVPGVISFFQRKQFSREYDELNAKLQLELNTKVKAAEEVLRKEIETVLKDEIEKVTESQAALKRELEKRIDIVRAGAFHVQANGEKDTPASCLRSCSWALPLYMSGDDERNIRSLLGIIKNSAKSLYSENFEDELLEVDTSTTSILDCLEKNNRNGRFDNDIRDIKFNLNKARKREKSGSVLTK